MYLIINGQKHSVARRLPSAQSVKFMSVSPAPAALTGTIEMYRDDGFLLSEDRCEDYSRRFVIGTLVTLTNEPEPTPTPVLPSLEEEMAAAIKEGVDSV